MTQTKIKGWCAWHKDSGYKWYTFSELDDSESIYLELADDLDEYPEGWEGSNSSTLEAVGWEVRECYLTIEDI